MHRREVRVLLHYSGDSKYSVNALIASLDKHGWGGKLVLARSPEELLDHAVSLASKGFRVIVGLSLMTVQIPRRLSLISRLRELGGRLGLFLVAGGSHPSGDPAGTILSLGFDAALVGEAEEAFPSLLEALEEGLDPYALRGVALRCGDHVFFRGRARPISLDEYSSFPYWRGLMGPIEITRGCVWGCRYCQVTYMHGALMRHRSIGSVLRLAEEFYRRGLRDLRFISPDSFSYGGDGRSIALDKLSELLEKLHALASRHGGRIFFGTFPSEVRPEKVVDDTMRVLKGRVANKAIIFGAQSGSPRILREIRRGHGVEEVLEAAETALKYGFRSDVDFIFGLPGESREDVEASLRLAERLVSMGARIHAHTFIPLPGSPYSEAPPGRIPLWAKKRLYKLIGRGGLYGQWEAQERLARQIHELRAKGLILGAKGWRMLRSTC